MSSQEPAASPADEQLTERHSVRLSDRHEAALEEIEDALETNTESETIRALIEYGAASVEFIQDGASLRLDRRDYSRECAMDGCTRSPVEGRPCCSFRHEVIANE